MPCPICGVSERTKDTGHNAWCSDCRNNKDVSYFDLSIRMPSVRYLANLAKKRQGVSREETINRIRDILIKYPVKQTEIPMDTYLYACSQCHITFAHNANIVSRYYEARTNFYPLCDHCANSVLGVPSSFRLTN